MNQVEDERTLIIGKEEAIVFEASKFIHAGGRSGWKLFAKFRFHPSFHPSSHPSIQPAIQP